MTEEEFEDAVRGCDPFEADVEGYSGETEFTFDCIMKRPEGDVCVSCMMTLDEDGRVEDVDYVTIRDYSELDEDENGDDAPIIDDPDEAGEVLEQLARRFTHESSDDDWPTDGPWTL